MLPSSYFEPGNRSWIAQETPLEVKALLMDWITQRVSDAGPYKGECSGQYPGII